MPKDDINYKFTENGIVYDFYDVFVPAENFRQPTLFTWGQNGGQLGDNTTTNRSTPVTTFSGGTTWKSIDGRAGSTAIKTDGTLWVWGSNTRSQLGTNNSTSRSTPVTTFAGGNNWKQVSGGREHKAAIKTDGTLWVWGYGGSNIGDNPGVRFGDVNTPVTTFAGGTNWKQVSCSQYNTLGIKTDGTLWVWGSNLNGSLGINDGTGTEKNTPVTTFAGGNTWKSVVGGTGSNSVAAIKTDGTLWVWGSNGSGILGTNDTTQRNTPVTTFAGGTTWKQVSVGGSHMAAIKTDGTLWTWGRNAYYGQLGINNTATGGGGFISTPVTTFAGGTNWKQVSAGNQYTVAIKTDGSLWVWGLGFYGNLGTNVNIGDAGIFTPVTTFAGGNNWKSVASGGNNTMAIKYSPDP